VRAHTRPGDEAVTAPPRAVARRYARALLDVATALPRGTAPQLQKELVAFVRQVEASAELRRVLLNPALSSDAKRRILLALADSTGASPLLRRLLELLASRDRVAILGALAEEYTQALNQKEGRVTAEAITAVPLAETQKAALATALGTTVGKTVELQSRVDEAVLGGVLVRVGGRTYDGTLRARLAALRAQLVSGR
jgi:F-type H+-transporting ATPase subunit delta